MPSTAPEIAVRQPRRRAGSRYVFVLVTTVFAGLALAVSAHGAMVITPAAAPVESATESAVEEAESAEEFTTNTRRERRATPRMRLARPTPTAPRRPSQLLGCLPSSSQATSTHCTPHRGPPTAD